ncbi:MAG: imidazole glycerol phosphate synthase subunit HisH [Acidobacteriota bacterium]|nr:MAG: imidazole glycerol phosphate synthase subunit HisH [Acidobacteriota bacterium]
MKVAIVRYNAGNTGSVTNALRRLGIEPLVTGDAEQLRSADRVIFPGVGEASSAMRSLRGNGLDKVLPSLMQPVLGICLGMQLLCESSEENSTECLGIVPAKVRRFEVPGLKVPHIGWNTIEGLSGPLFSGVAEDSYAYFVHGYFVEDCAAASAWCEYGVTFTAALQMNNFHATQFHCEKSGPVGERILANFLGPEEQM